jgi:hypothetical protein
VLRDAAVRAPRSRRCTHMRRCLTATPQVALGITGLPDEVLPEMLESDTFMKAFHHVLLEVRPAAAS